MKFTLSHILLFITLLCCPSTFAQSVDDAVINAQTQYEGTARSMAMGNATGAVGGDITAVCINPAGLGLYRTQEFTFSLAPQHQLCLTNYYGTSQYAQRFRVTMPSMGFVITAETSNYKPLRYVQFSVGMTRTNDLNYQQQTKGLNPTSSMVDAYLQTVNDIDQAFDPDIDLDEFFKNNHPYDLSPAWATYLIDRYVDDEGQFYYNSPVPQGNVWQSDDLTSKGRSEEWTMALAANYFDKLFLGASLGLAHLKRVSTRTYQETPNDANSDFTNWEHIEDLSDNAWGANFKIGIIYFPTSWLRIGAAWHSSTTYNIAETWFTETQTTLKDNDGNTEYRRNLSPTLDWTYGYRTPHTFVGSLAFLFGQRGMIATDVEYLNYRSSKFSFDGADDGVNKDIIDMLKPSFNIRLGTEWRARQLFLRGGLAYYGSPYGFGENYGSVKKFGLGLGYAVSQATSFDFAYELSQSTTGYTPYRHLVDGQNDVEDAIRHQWRNKLTVTLKVKL